MINYSLDLSQGIEKQYKIIDKEYSFGGKNSSGNYWVIIIYQDEELKVRLPSEEYDKYNIDDYIKLTEYTGCLNIKYFEYGIVLFEKL